MALTPTQIAKSNTESAHQKAVFAHFALTRNAGQYLETEWLHHIPNGGLRDKVTASRLKAEGVKDGVLDLFLPVARGIYHGLYIEMKRPGQENHKNGGRTPNQVKFSDFVMGQGFAVVIAYSWGEAVNYIIQYLELGEFQR